MSRAQAQKEEVQRLLRKLGVSPQKARGQNFLLSSHYGEEILAFADLDYEKEILEIGPGLGILTAILYARKPSLKIVELERAFCAYLSASFPDAKIFQQDVLRLRLSDLLGPDNSGKLQIVSNLPYSISSEVLFWILEQADYVKSACLLLQKEFAERVAASPGTKAYGILSVQAQVVAKLELGFCISGDEFFPEAEVDSRLLRIEIPEQAIFKIEDKVKFTRVLKASFATRRKTIANNLKKAGFLNYEQVLSELGIERSQRAETISPAQYVELARLL